MKRIRQNLTLPVFSLLLVGLFWGTLSRLVTYSLSREDASHIILIPFVTAFLLFSRWWSIFEPRRVYWFSGSLMIAIGAVIFFVCQFVTVRLDEGNLLSILVFAIVLIWCGGFAVLYGKEVFRRALFPVLFLFLMVPIPSYLLRHTIYLLQEGSSDVAYFLFQLVRLPVLRQGFVFRLPGLTIEVAQECSGIRSSLALVIIAMLAGYWFLDKKWERGLFVVIAVPIAILKNGVRIVALSLLSIYVNPQFMYGNLHRNGGVLFFMFGLLLLYPILRLLAAQHRPCRSENLERSALVNSV